MRHDCPVSCKSCPLRNSDAFLPVTAEELDFTEKFRSEMTDVDAGGSIIPEHKKSANLFTVFSGWGFRYKTLSDGRRQILNFLFPGDFVGLQEEFSDDATHGVEALTKVTLCVFPRDGLWELFRQYPSLGYDVTWLAARQEGIVDGNLLTTGRRNATERVAMLLVHLFRRAERLGMAQDGWIDFPLNQQHIADALGLSLVHTNKTMRRLLTLGLHRLEGGRLRLLNPKVLARIADYADQPIRSVPLI